MVEEKIKYFEEEAWEKYFGELAQLYTNVSAVLEARDLIIAESMDRTVGSLIRENPMWKEIFFGGMSRDGDFEKNALAKFYGDCLGIKIDSNSLQKIVSRIREGINLESASDDVKPSVEEPPVVKLLREIKKTLRVVFRQLGRDIPEISVKEISDSRSAVSLMENVLNSGKKFLPLYNPLSFFIMSIYSVPKFYVREIYTELFDEEVQKVLEKYDVRIVDLIYPDLPDEKIRKDRNVVGLEKDCVGWTIYNLILMLYRLFQNESLKEFFSIEDEFNKYLEIYADKLRESIMIDQFSDVINVIRRGHYYKSFYGLKLKDPFGRYPYYSSYEKGTIEGGNVKIESYTLSYTKFLAFMTPVTFLGFGYIRPVSEKEFTWGCILGWES